MNAQPASIEIVYLTAPSCRLCEHGRQVLAELSQDRPLELREVDLLSVEGQQLLAVSRVPFPPAVFVGGEMLAHGRLSASALGRQLDRFTEAGEPVATPDRSREA